MIVLSHLDHLVLTVLDIKRTCAFYRGVLGMTVETFAEGRTALRLGAQKINLKRAASSSRRRRSPPPARPTSALSPARGSKRLEADLERSAIAIAIGPMRSLYIRDPDGNLIEISNPAPEGPS
jgi:catechol 2,3-dioxygenase-like lactoylglutathione lyase family enzyme